VSEPTLRSIFGEALDLAAEERARFLDQACATDAALRQQIEALLRAHDDAGAFFTDPTKRPEIPPAENAPAIEGPGGRIGRYKLLQQIGEGGCGVVYMAEQEMPVRRRVALKILKLGMDTKQVIARFEAERQAVALMDHPNIAKVLDAGATDTGRPYFVMDLIRGVKITEYCDQTKASTEERLKLFVLVCQAVQHAHQKGVIHRDLKPSNILVTVNDGVAIPKVIDFGIAKATQGRLTDQTLFTAFEQFIGTPAYMSPEQAVMTTLDVDTRSDIYSLGVLLYELLTGHPPFEQKELLAVGLDEMRRTIREKEPRKPSTCLISLGKAELTTAAERRQTEAPKLVGLVQGDLDWIVMKCLEKDRARRYETATGLAADINRYLHHEPVFARPPSRLYLLHKLARRNRAALVVGTAIFLALLTAVFVLTLSNVRIRYEQSQKQNALAKALKSEQEGKEQLFKSLKSQAEARRLSRQLGQRLGSLAALQEAAAIHRDDELRDAVIAALAVPDLRPGPAWDAFDTTNTECVCFDANYQRYACIDKRGIISIHTVSENREIQRFPSDLPVVPYGSHRSMLFSPDGRFLAKFEVGFLWSVWSVDDGKMVLRTPKVDGMGFAFTGDSTGVAFSISNVIVICDLPSGKERKRWRVQQPPHALAFSPDQRRLASGPMTNDVVSIFDIDSAEEVTALPVGLGGGDRALAWHPSGQYLAVSTYEHIQFWDVKSSARVSTLEGHAQTVSTIAFDPSGSWLIADSWEGEPRLWQPAPAREWARFFSGENRLRFSPDGKWAGVLYPGEGKAQLLEFFPSQTYKTFLGSHLDSLHSFSLSDISPDGRLIALTSQRVSIRELPGGRVLAEVPPVYGYASRVMFHPNGKELLISGLKKWMEIWPIARDETAPHHLRVGPPRLLPLPFVPFEFALAEDGRTLAVTDAKEAGEARFLDLSSGKLSEVRFPHNQVDIVAITPDGKWLATSAWGTLEAKLWNAKTGECVLDLFGARARVSFTPDGQELVVSTSSAYSFYDVATRKQTRRFQRQASMHQGWIAFSDHGRLMAMELAPGVIHLCETKSGRTIANLQDPNWAINHSFYFTPDGTQLLVVATFERAIHRWDLRAMREQLKAMDLDWDWPEFPPASREERESSPLTVEVLTGASQAESRQVDGR
jgi:serine/threonine protein kinase/WD40 repeat protein